MTEFVHNALMLGAHAHEGYSSLSVCLHSSASVRRVQQIELTNQVSTALQRLLTDGFC